ncbi:hypothetical protein HZH66_011709 [Vespula vulgaris]|uniref:Uncharacterized protein n=1 Tax=Vespula vulgaris TaxID=7454 RepID=A0A834JDG2_VESVU|nr:hypothetical protein HZH66_011709 [Vespula vulgaris]
MQEARVKCSWQYAWCSSFLRGLEVQGRATKGERQQGENWKEKNERTNDDDEDDEEEEDDDDDDDDDDEDDDDDVVDDAAGSHLLSLSLLLWPSQPAG